MHIHQQDSIVLKENVDKRTEFDIYEDPASCFKNFIDAREFANRLAFPRGGLSFGGGGTGGWSSTMPAALGT